MMGPTPTGHDDEDWTIDHSESLRYLGTTDDGQTAAFYHADEHAVYHGDLDYDERTVTAHDESAHSLDASDSLGRFLEDVGDETGWDSLSEFAENHLEDEDASV